MECTSCQTPLPENARFCPSCATPAPALASQGPADPLRETLRVALGRQYEIGRLLGKGGMGAVYLAREAALERDVAIKVLPPDRGDTEDSRDRFRREARTAAKLSHPNIVPLHTFGDVDGTLYFIMGYVKGESLATRLKREGKLAVEESRRILIEVAEALEYAHKLGIVHRDIKPDNVLIDEGTGRAMLTDFGIAKAMGAGQTMTTAGSVIGTPQYMSPEQAQGKSDIDARSDLYSLGVMGYAMLAGRLPFEGPTPGDVMVQHITKEPPTLASLTTGVPVEMTTALTRCLAKDPHQRWPDAQKLKRGLAPIEASAIPEEMVEISTWTQVLLGSVLLSGLVELRRAIAIPDPDPIARYGLNVGSVFRGLTGFLFLGWVLLLGLGVRKGYPWRQVLGFAFIKPRWWFGSYPQALRLPGDVWLRLPSGLRRARALLWAVVLFNCVIWASLLYVTGASDTFRRTGHRPEISRVTYQAWRTIPRPVRISVALIALAATVAMLVATCLHLSRWFRRVHTLKMGSFSANGLLFGDTARGSFWSRPEIAALLLPGDSGPAQSMIPTSPSELGSAIAAAVSGLEGELAAFGDKVRDAGHELSKAVVVLDGQISALAGSVDPAEAERLAAKIVILGPASHGEGDEKQQMRDLFQKQLDLLRGLQARLEDLKTRRARRMELLKGLWLQAIELQASSGDPTKAGDTTDRIRKLFGKIEEQTAAVKSRAADGETHALADLPTIER